LTNVPVQKAGRRNGCCRGVKREKYARGAGEKSCGSLLAAGEHTCVPGIKAKSRQGVASH